MQNDFEKPKLIDRAINIGSVVALSIILSGCANTLDRLNKVGQEPELTSIKNPKLDPEYREVSIPLPDPSLELKQANSLWSSRNKSIFQDQRAVEIGDILTVLIDIEDEATLENSTERTRSSAEDLDIPGLLGLQTQLTDVLPEGTTPQDLINLGSTSTSVGDGTIEREEEIVLRLAAMVTQALPNGNMVIHGRQEVRVNHEVRDLEIAGIIRPSDIAVGNTIEYDRIAEARISYGGRGLVSDVQKPRYGTEVLDILLPF